jgi:hypothetical protein
MISAAPWSTDAKVAQKNLQHELDHIANVIAKIELVLGQLTGSQLSELEHGL